MDFSIELICVFQKNVGYSVEMMVRQIRLAANVFVNNHGLERNVVCMSEL